VNEAGDRQTPAVVAINDDEILTGLSAKQNIIRNAENTILYGKYFIGNSTTLADDGSNMEEILKKTYCQVRRRVCHTHMAIVPVVQ
jgi:molecular chaperone DnaK (HSP70)